jgi:hypothetical protein
MTAKKCRNPDFFPNCGIPLYFILCFVLSRAYA